MERVGPDHKILKSAVLRKIYGDFKKSGEAYEMSMMIHKRLMSIGELEVSVGVGGSVLSYLPGSMKGKSPLIITTDISTADRDTIPTPNNNGTYNSSSISSSVLMLESTRYIIENEITHPPLVLLFTTENEADQNNNAANAVNANHIYHLGNAGHAIEYVPGGKPGELVVQEGPELNFNYQERLADIYRNILEERGGQPTKSERKSTLCSSRLKSSGLEVLTVATGVESYWGPHRIDLAQIKILSEDLIALIQAMT